MSRAEDVKAPPQIQRGLFNVYLDTTEISDVDGARGRLSYRGIAIEDLAGRVPYLDVFHLLIVGGLPSDADRQAMEALLAEGEGLAPEVLHRLGDLASWNPTAVLRNALSVCLPLQSLSLTASHAAELWPASLRVLGFAGAVIRHQAQALLGQPQGAARSGAFTASILAALTNRKPSPLECELIDLAFVALAEHSLAASTLTARVVASAQGEFVAAIAAAMAAFAGRLHGGAIDDVTAMLMEIGTPDRVAAWVCARRQQRQPVPGFGHRVYRTRDPRADLLAAAAKRLGDAGKERTLLKVMDVLSEEMRSYRQHGIDFNVDAYASVLFLMLDIPRQFYVALFALARIAGWCAHIEEQVRNNILIRPRLLYRGATTRAGERHE